ncbi:MAG: 2-polyprenylphenol 6-hydroxylase, partial [Alphaproteobacteria bacterium]
GQTLSTRADLIGEEMAADLSELQDRLPPFAGAQARRTIEEELGRPLEALFTRFDDTPAAAASIAQVHHAVTTEGREVAVKVLRPGIEAAFSRDLDLFYWVAALAERTQPDLRRLRPVEVVRTFAEGVRLEMDLRLEAAAASELGENFQDDPTFRVPKVDWLRTARRVLTLDLIGGIAIDERQALIDAGHDLDDILAKAAAAFFAQVFRDGFFHADLHPGNLFVDPDGNIVAVDFGIMGRLDRKTRCWLAEMLLAFLNGDYRRAAEVHFEAGYVAADKSLDAFTQACRSIAEPILERPLNEISLARLLAQLFQVTKAFEMRTQPQLLLLQKTMLVIEGVGRNLNPETNVWHLARPLIKDWMQDNTSPEARVRDATAEALESLERLPGLIRDASASAALIAEGGLRLHPDTIRALKANNPARKAALWPLWAAIALIALVALAALLW